MRIETPINFSWQYKKGFSDSDIYTDDSDVTYVTVDIPHIPKEIDVNYYLESAYACISCYRKKLTIKKTKGKRYFLKFEGVAHICDVFFNGILMQSHCGGYTEFFVEITDSIIDGENLLCVKVDSTENPKVPPFGAAIDFATFGGIYREVTFITTSDTYIRDVILKTCDIKDKTVLFKVFIENVKKLQAKIAIFDGSNQCIESCDVEVDGNFEKTISNQDFKLWDVENPNLYWAEISLIENKNVIDTYKVSFGIRVAEFRKDGFYLNEKKLKLVGLNRHQSYPHVGYAFPKQAQIDDADILKSKLGLNIVRGSHYPQSKHFLNRCDEIGLLVFEEMVGWQHIGDTEWKNNYLNNLKEMIISHRNHPCIIIWGVRINESMDDTLFYQETNNLARKLDTTRQTGGVRCSKHSELLEDVYTYNDFVHNGTDRILIDKALATNSENTPYLVTEFNGHMYPTKSFDTENRLLEHALRHAKIVDKYLGDPELCGGIGWCFADYNTHHDFGGGDMICYHGVLDIFRNEKLASYFYMSQQEKYAVLMPSCQMDLGEQDQNLIEEIYIFTNCDFVEFFKNNMSFGKFFPDSDRFKHLKHPPIYIKNLLQNILVDEEGFTTDESKKAIDFLSFVIKEGGLNSISNHTKKMISTHEKRERIWNIYSKYMVNLGNRNGKYDANFENQKNYYRINGYKNGEIVKTVELNNANEIFLECECSRNVLNHCETYDTQRIILKAQRSKGMIAKYCFDVLHLETSGNIELVGDDHVSLIAGMRSIWVKSTKEGKGKLTIKSNRFSDICLDFEIKGEPHVNLIAGI